MKTASKFAVPKMDCPSEERLIRFALETHLSIHHLHFDLSARTLVVVHDGSADQVMGILTPLHLGARLESSDDAVSTDHETSKDERGVLRVLLAINAGMFVMELGFGFAAQSTGLVADAVDMLADAFVYGVSLYAVGRALSAQRRAARLSGWLQVVLGVGALGEVARRALMGSEPGEAVIIIVGLLALVANLACVALLAKHRRGGVHLRASWIFTSTDALANLGVVAAGVLVALTGSSIPDLVVGTLVGVLVLSSAVRILRLTNRK